MLKFCAFLLVVQLTFMPLSQCIILMTAELAYNIMKGFAGGISKTMLGPPPQILVLPKSAVQPQTIPMSGYVEPAKNVTIELLNEDNSVTSCESVQISGIYQITIGSGLVSVFCDAQTDGGGWTVIQRRFDGSVDFYRNYMEYQKGFGIPDRDYFIGLDNLHILTTRQPMELRILFQDFNGNQYFQHYSHFEIAPVTDGYRLVSLGTSSGNAGDSLRIHEGQRFSTFDVDNDAIKETNCATKYKGAWWYNKCQNSNLNGPYIATPVGIAKVGITWNGIQPRLPLPFVQMMVRPARM